jgi:hypothetical protein
MKMRTIRTAILMLIGLVLAVGCASEEPGLEATTVTVVEEQPKRTELTAASGTQKVERQDALARVNGSLGRGCGTFGCADEDAAASLRARSVYCYWEDTHVKVHLTLENTFGARVAFSITPKYEILNGGTHGTSFGSDEEVKLDAGEAKSVDLYAGSPEGVKPGSEISACLPDLYNADIG